MVPRRGGGRDAGSNPCARYSSILAILPATVSSTILLQLPFDVYKTKKMKEIRKDTVSGHEDLACVQSGHRSSSIQFNDLFFKMSPHTKREPRLNDDGDRLREIESHVNE